MPGRVSTSGAHHGLGRLVDGLKHARKFRLQHLHTLTHELQLGLRFGRDDAEPALELRHLKVQVLTLALGLCRCLCRCSRFDLLPLQCQQPLVSPPTADADERRRCGALIDAGAVLQPQPLTDGGCRHVILLNDAIFTQRKQTKHKIRR